MVQADTSHEHKRVCRQQKVHEKLNIEEAGVHLLSNLAAKAIS